MPNHKQNDYQLNDKIKLYNNLIDNYNIKNIELGMVNLKFSSIINNPIFNDTIELLNNVEYIFLNSFNKEMNNYVLVRETTNLSHSKYELIHMLSSGVQNFSFTLSNIYNFQKQQNLSKIKQFNQLYNLLLFIQDLPPLNLKKNIELYSTDKPFNIRLYIDYEYHTPISEIISHLLYLHKFHIDKICIVDRHGKMKKTDLIFLLEHIAKKSHIEQFSLQLHCNKENENNVEELFHIALDYGINEFNTIENILYKDPTRDKNIIPVLNYKTYYKFLANYLICKN